MNAKKIKGQHIVYIVIGILLTALLWINAGKDRKVELNLTKASQNDVIAEWTPGITLPAGEYQFGIVISNNNSDTINHFRIRSQDEGIIFEEELNAIDYSQWYDITLENPSNILFFQTETEDGTFISLNQAVIVVQQGVLYRDGYFLAFIFAILYSLLGIYYFSGKKMTKEMQCWALISCAVLLASVTLLKSYLISGHDIRFHLYRIESVKDALLAGQFPVRMHTTYNNGYGYATGVVYPELFLYIPALLRILGMSIPTAYNTFMFLLNVLTAVIMYYSVRSITKSYYGATIASIIMVLFPYRLVCMYERAAVGEVLGLAFLPLILCGLYHMIFGDQKKWYLLVVAATFTLQSHMISVLLAAAVGVTICVCCVKCIFSEKRWVGFIKMGVTMVLVNFWYIVPFLDFYRMDLGVKTMQFVKFYENAAYPAQVFNMIPDTLGMSYNLNAGMRGEMPMTMGFVVTLALVVLLYVLYIKKERAGKFVHIMVLLSLGLAFMSTTWFPWNYLEKYALIEKIVNTIQFPWRLLGYAGVLIILAFSCWMSDAVEGELKAYKRIILLAGAILAAYPTVTYNMCITQQPIFVERVEAVDAAGSAGSNYEYLLAGTDRSRFISANYITSGEHVVIKNTHKFASNVTFAYEGAQDGDWVEVPLLWYPGYVAVNEAGESLTTNFGNGNILRIYLQGEQDTVRVYFKERKMYLAADAVSLATILGGAVMVAKQRKKRKASK